MIDFNYANVVSTIGTLGTVGLTIWTIYAEKERKKQNRIPKLKVYIQSKEKHNGFGNNINCYTAYRFFIQNIGLCGVTILECMIDDKPVVEFDQEIIRPEIIIGADLQPQGSINCPMKRSRASRIAAGSKVKLVYKSAYGKTFTSLNTLSEEME